jgi:hypothetical protein
MFIISYLYDIIRNNVVSIGRPVISIDEKKEISTRICDMNITQAADIDKIKKMSHNSLLEICILFAKVNNKIIKYALNDCDMCRVKRI